MMSLCRCGCGKPAPIAKATNNKLGHVKGQPIRFISGHNSRGSGKRVWFMNNGRWYVASRDGKHMLWSHIVMWDILGRPIAKGEVVHHIDGDSQNDEPSNLRLYSSNAEHRRDAHSDQFAEMLIRTAVRILGAERVIKFIRTEFEC